MSQEEQVMSEVEAEALADDVTVEVEGSVDQTEQEILATKPSISEIKKRGYEKIPSRFLKSKKQGGTNITFVPHYHATRIFDHITNGHWSYEIVTVDIIGTLVRTQVRVTIHAREGEYSFDGQGIEEVDKRGYGDPASNSESMALRRALMRAIGLGYHLYATPIR